jgi:hypothetical protein
LDTQESSLYLFTDFSMDYIKSNLCKNLYGIPYVQILAMPLMYFGPVEQ